RLDPLVGGEQLGELGRRAAFDLGEDRGRGRQQRDRRKQRGGARGPGKALGNRDEAGSSIGPQCIARHVLTPDEATQAGLHSTSRNGLTGSPLSRSTSVPWGAARAAIPSGAPATSVSPTATSVLARPVTRLVQPPACSMITMRP